MSPLLIPLAIILILVGVLFLRTMWKWQEQQLKKFKDFAEQMGMEFSAKGDRTLRESLATFDLFSKGDAAPPIPSLINVLHGDSEQLGYGEEFEVRTLDFTYQSGKSTISQTVICFRSSQLSLPDFSMRPEYFFHKIGSKLGYQDIDFESHLTAVEFSKKYLLRGKDEQKIRALFTDEVLAFFAGQDKICVEGFSSHLCFYRARKLIEPEDIPAFMKEGFEVFRLFTQEQN